MNSSSSSLIAQLDNPFWRFSLSVYQHETVKIACLTMQENYQVNVNTLLMCCWLAYAVEEVTEAQLLHACHLVYEWNTEITKSLRKTRHWIKSLPVKNPWVDDFAQQILIDEMVSETYQQYQLFSCFENNQKKSVAANHAVAINYLSWIFTDLKLPMDNELKEAINHLVATVYSQVATLHYENGIVKPRL